jgi:hypothetical protein
MKSLLVICALTFSVTAFAKTSATQAVANFLVAGEHTSLENNCSVSVVTTDDSVSVKVSDSEGSSFISISNNSDSYIVIAETGEIAAHQNVRIPASYQTANRTFSMRKVNGDLEVYITNAFIDRHGIEHVEYSSCSLKN